MQAPKCKVCGRNHWGPCASVTVTPVTRVTKTVTPVTRQMPPAAALPVTLVTQPDRLLDRLAALEARVTALETARAMGQAPKPSRADIQRAYRARKKASAGG